MATTIADIEAIVRNRLIETTPKFWSSAELQEIEINGIKDLWRDIVDLKQEHYLTINNSDVSFPSNSNQLVGVPNDVHKIYLIEARDTTQNSNNVGLQFLPLDYNDGKFRAARSSAAIDPVSSTIWYSISSQGAPVNAPTIICAPKVNSSVNISFCYIPTLKELTSNSPIPIPGEANNAIVAWTVAFARAKEREDRSPDPNWLATYATEKQHLLQSLGLRQYQEPEYVTAEFEEYWG